MRALGTRLRGRRSLSTVPARVAALRSRLADEAALSPSDFSSHHRHHRPRGGESAAGPSAAEAAVAAEQREQREALRIQMPMDAPFVDRFARRHDYLRISLTERCNLRCRYCMPEDGVQLTPNSHLLSSEEVLRLASLFVDAGVSKIRLTGGEPTLRRDLPDLVASLNALRPRGLRQIGITSNGIALGRMLPGLVESGLDRLNISLDTLDGERFIALTRRNGLARVLRTIDEALELMPDSPLKINNVLMSGTNDGELLDFARLSIDRPIHVRFIEYMPFDGNSWAETKMVPFREMLGRVEQQYPGLSRVETDRHDVAVTWRLPDAKGTVSFIASMTQPFCAGCNRLRITADGNLKVSAARARLPRAPDCHAPTPLPAARPALLPPRARPRGSHPPRAPRASGVPLRLGRGLAARRDARGRERRRADRARARGAREEARGACWHAHDRQPEEPAHDDHRGLTG